MVSKQRRRKLKRARAAGFVVRVCRAQVLATNIGAIMLAPLVAFFGLWLLVEGRVWRGACILVFSCAIPVALIVLSRRDVDKIVLTFTPKGLKHYDRFVDWDHISGVELKHRNKGPNYILLSVRDGKIITIEDDQLDRRIEDIFREIQKRVGVTE